MGQQHLVWCAHPRLSGTVAWGRIHEATATAALAAWEFETSLLAPYDAIIDLSGVTGVDSAAFELVAAYMADKMPALAKRVRRQALVRPPGMPGALVAGFYPTLSPGFAWRDFADRAAAFDWCLDAPIADELSRLIDDARDTTSLLSRLRHHLLAHPKDGALPSVARLLGVSARTLQRALQDAGSAFRTEVQHARVEVARALLSDSDLKLEAIAHKVGCSSLPTFMTLFRRVAKETPNHYRERIRRG